MENVIFEKTAETTEWDAEIKNACISFVPLSADTVI